MVVGTGVEVRVLHPSNPVAVYIFLSWRALSQLSGVCCTDIFE